MINDQPQGTDPAVARYSRVAGEYDSRWSFYLEQTIGATMARLSPLPEARILDVGCGTGALLSVLAREFPGAALAGVDLVPEMLAVARRRLPLGVDLQVARAESLPFQDCSFDLVVSTSMLHHIRQPDTALSEINRVLRPGGELVITDWCGDYLTCRLLEWWLRIFRRERLRVYRERDLARLFGNAGLRDVQIDRYRINWFWGLMTARAAKQAPAEHDGIASALRASQ